MKKTVVIDPGHGGTKDLLGSSANNAVGPNGLLEKQVTLDVAIRTARLLEELDFEVLLTRPPGEDVNVSAADRAAVARNVSAPVFLSIHFNGFNDATVQGTETLVRPVGSLKLDDVDPSSRRLAQTVQAGVVAALGHKDRGLKPGRWAVLSEKHHHAATARCLVEVSFLTDPGEEVRLADEPYRDRIATALCKAVKTYFADAAGSKSAAPQMYAASGMGRWAVGGEYSAGYDPDGYGSPAGSPDVDDEGEGDEYDPGHESMAFRKGCEPDAKPHTDAHCSKNYAEDAETDHFKLREFRCHDGTECPKKFRGHLQHLMENLEVLREELDAPIYILSGYRSPHYNWQVVCGAKRSKHMCGMAADLRSKEHTPNEIYATIERLIGEGRMVQGGLHAYSSFVHYDVRGHKARW